MSGISQTEAAAYKAKSIARGRLMERFRDAVHNICDGAVNEVDRVYFGSTNDFEYLKECALEMEDWNWDRIMREREEIDPYAVMKDQRSNISALEEENKRLREALNAMVHAVCGETGFANAVRVVSGTQYPWPALDLAEAKAIAALETKS